MAKIQKSKHLVTVLSVFLAGLGLGALIVGNVWLQAYQSYTSYTSYRTYTSDRSDKADRSDQGFRDPLITLLKPTAAFRSETPLAPEVLGTDPVRGDAQAPVSMVVFGDMADAATRIAWPMLQEVWESNQDTVQLVWKDFPLPLNPGSREAAVAARCAQEQGKFWQFLDTKFQIPDSKFEDVVAELNMDTEAFERCMQSPRIIDLVNLGMEEAQTLEVDAVPTVFVGPYRLSGAVTAGELERLVQLELSAL